MALSATLQLWLFDLSTTRKLCEMFSESPTVSGLHLLDHNRKVVFEKNPSPEDVAVNINKKLLHEGEKLVGYVDIYFSNTAWERHRANILIVGILMVLGTMLGAFYFSYTLWLNKRGAVCGVWSYSSHII